MKVVISQPMLFPWVGLFEQIRLCDTFVHYDDVQFPLSREGFIHRVQLKSASGVRWLQLPVIRQGKQLINQVRLSNHPHWKQEHLQLLQEHYGSCPFKDEMLDLVNDVYASETEFVSEVNIRSIESTCRYFGIETNFCKSSDLGIGGSSTQRITDITRSLGGTTYITGHGAVKYFDHEWVERQGLAVEYIDYLRVPYAQLHAPFTPYVSILDLIANTGTAGKSVIASQTIPWREFVNSFQASQASASPA